MIADTGEHALPPSWFAIQRRTTELGFDMPSEPRAAALLRLLAASKPGGRLLELGTGTGLATAALLSGMSADAQLVTVDIDERVQTVAREALGSDHRVSFVLQDGLGFIREQAPATFDLVFADAMPGKYEATDEALSLVRHGGFFIGDDMLPQPNWPASHQDRVDQLIAYFQNLPGWTTTCLGWGSGFILAVRTAS